MSAQNQKGFTIIEVILFLALSGAFLMIAFIGIRGRTEAVQFTDSMRSLRSFLVSEQNKVTNGLNTSATLPADCITLGNSTIPGESNKCVLVGRIVSFNNTSSKVDVNVMFGDKEPTKYSVSTSDIEKISDITPRADGTSSSYDIEWETTFNLGKSKNSNPKDISDISMLGWLRSPDSSRVLPIVFANGESVDATNAHKPYLTGYAKTAIFNDVNTRLCFTGNNKQVASISFDSNGRLSLIFDDVECL